MAKSPENETVKDNQPATSTTAKKQNVVNIPPQHQPWVYSVAAVFVLLVVFSLGIWAANNHRDMEFGTSKVIPADGAGQLGVKVNGDGQHFVTGGRFGDGSSGLMSGQNHTMGVVTAVNGSGFTIAGNGSTTQVTTDSSTQYHNGDQVKQNDTVLVSGTTSNGTLSATNIVINP